MLNLPLALLKPQPQYIGQVTTGCCANDQNFIYSAFGGGTIQGQVRSPQVMMAQTQWIKIGIPNWALVGLTGEVLPGATLTVSSCYIEYPSGTFRQVTFAGSGSGTATDGNNLVSDMFLNPPPKGALFWVRYHTANPNGVTLHVPGVAINSGLGEAFAYGTSVTDQSASGTITTTDPTITTRPAFIIGPTTVPSVALPGDSRTVGLTDTYSTGSNDLGELARSIGVTLPYIGIACSGDGIGGAAGYNAGHSKRQTLVDYCSHVVSTIGINDIGGGPSLGTMQAGLQTMWASFNKPGRTFHGTIAPFSTGTFTTTGGQTTHSSNSVRVAVNAWLRGVPAGIAGYFEVADAVESARDSGIWKANYTGDGVHELQVAALAIVAAKGVRPERLHF